MSAIKVNCNEAFTYQVDLKVPADGTGGQQDTGEMVTPNLGVVTGIKLRLSLTSTGAAIDGSTGPLSAVERANKAGRFYFRVSQAIQKASLLTLGAGADYYAIWSNAAGFDCLFVHCQVADSTEVV
jgi:hypothetical protein